MGNGSVNQISMPGGLQNLTQSEAPTFANAQSTYQYPCNSSNNPRLDHCDEVLSTFEIAENTRFLMFPNPAKTMFNIEADKAISQIDILNQQGQIVKTTNTKNISISELPNGLYFVKASFLDKGLRVEKLIKE